MCPQLPPWLLAFPFFGGKIVLRILHDLWVLYFFNSRGSLGLFVKHIRWHLAINPISNNMTISESRNRNKQRCAKVQRCSLSWVIRRKSLDSSNIDHQLVNQSGSKDLKLVLIFFLSPASLSQHQENCFSLLLVKCSKCSVCGFCLKHFYWCEN